MRSNLRHGVLTLPVCAAILALTGCGGGSSNGTTHTVGGNVSGLSANQSVTLVDNGGDALTVSTNGKFMFSTSLAAGATYSVKVQSHEPGVTCSVSNGSGTIGSSNVTGVGVLCAASVTSALYSFMGGTTDGMRPQAGLIMDGAGNLYGTTSAGGPFTSAGGANGDGTVFEVSASGRESVLYSFGGYPTDGMRPLAGLVMDGAGNLYGTTEAGGANLDGAVFKLTPSGTETILHSFGAAPDGSTPFAALIIDSAGNLYGTTFTGGANGGGTVFEIDATGAETVLYSFKGGTSDGAGPRAALTMDSAGNLYGTTSAGGANNDGTVFEIGATGTETVLYSFKGGTSDGAAPMAGLIMDAAGNLYGTTEGGGANGDGTVFEIGAAGAETVLYSFKGGAKPSGGLLMDSAGNLYGVTGSGGANNDGTVFEISAAGAESVLHFFAGGASDGASPVGRLAMDSAGNLHGTTAFGGLYGYGTVFKIN